MIYTNGLSRGGAASTEPIKPLMSWLVSGDTSANARAPTWRFESIAGPRRGTSSICTRSSQVPMLVPYGDSDEEEAPPAKSRRLEGVDFFASGAGAEQSSSEEEEEALAPAPLAAQPQERSSLLPPVDALFETVERPAFLEVELRQRVAQPEPAASQQHVSAPVRYTAQQAERRAVLSQLREEEAAAAELDAAAPPQREERSVRRLTAAVPLSSAAANPSLSLPRKEQERRDREKSKREKGQSAHATWKSEAEMVLRQGYD